MAYFMINGADYSPFVNSLSVETANNYTAQTNAAGNSVVDYINRKRTITVGIIPLTDADMLRVQQAIDKFSVSITFRNPRTNALEENVACIIPSDEVEYYTIRTDKVMYNAITLTFTEL